MATIASQPQPLTKDDAPTLDQLLSDCPKKIEEAPFYSWDYGVFAQELVSKHLVQIVSNAASPDTPIEVKEPEGQIKEGTWGRTQLALTDIYVSFFDATGIETTIAQVIKDRAEKYVWSDDANPPHLKSMPTNDPYDASQMQIFSTLGLLNAKYMLKNITPTDFLGRASKKVWSLFEGVVNGRNDSGASMKDIENNNKNTWRRKTATDVMQGKNIGGLPDWWSDARYAQQQITGTNPTTICLASADWIQQFKDAAHAQGSDAADAEAFLASAEPKSLFVQDCSYLCKAVKAKSSDTLNSADEQHYACATVSLFHLGAAGQLHPVAIVVDYKGDMDSSVVAFNNRLTPIVPGAPEASKLLEQGKSDWPWRYAKTCAQVSDWIRHEITIHLVNTHIVEEVIIVAANRCFEIDHPVFKLLEPHWYRTLPLNAAAREVLLPSIIFDLIGLKDQQPYDLVQYTFEKFNFTDCYIPTDLPKRGFPIHELEAEKFKNYPYAKNMHHMWGCIRKFVKSMLDLHSDEEIFGKKPSDNRVKAWSHEVQIAGKMKSFPTIETRDQLVNAITMCIHIASPQHTAVNYLQNFYQVFIPAKPPALYTPLPKSLAELKKITETDLLRALPVGRQRDWLLAAHVPWLLSFKTAEESSLTKYAKSLWNLVRKKSGMKNDMTKACASELVDGG